MNWSLTLAAFAIGMAFAAQPAVNFAAARVLGTPIFAAMLSIAITLVTMIGYALVVGAKVEPGAFARLPWWVVLGGLIGFFVVFGGVSIAPVIGAAVFFVCLVAGQLVGAALIDQFGAFGMAVREISPLRVAGLGLTLAGVILVILGSR